MEKKFDEKACREWYKNKNINPITKRKITIDGRLYKDIQKICTKYKNLSLSDDTKDVNSNKTFNDINHVPDVAHVSHVLLSNKMNEEENHYPNVMDDSFRDKINQLDEFAYHKYPKPEIIQSLDNFEEMMSKECMKGKEYDKAIFQYFVQQYMSLRTPYRGLLMYHSVGTGKTCAAVSIAETVLKVHKLTDGPSVYVILPPALKSTFINTIMDSNCVNSVYDIVNDKSKVKKIISKRYHIMTYGEFVKSSLDLNNKTIIVDEAHNLRNSDDTNDDKDNKAYDILLNRLKEGKNNRLVLMSATPMYNEPSEIVDLLNLLLVNEKKDMIKFSSMSMSVLGELSSRYISYINSNNPFLYAQKFRPKECFDSVLPYGYIPVKLSKKQIDLHKKMKQEDIYLQGFTIANIGQSVLSLFNLNKTYSYKDKSNPVLYPDDKHLGLYSPKILKICKSIEKSKGIVIVYSRFLMDGILPMALALEHMGYSRYKDDNLLDYKNEKRDSLLNYAILTSPNPEYIGNMKSFDKILSVCNSKDNIDGNLIKVILITKKASEGLSFMNVREIHVLDPWFHNSRIEQIVGRGVRRCSHINLNIANRNVLVYVYMGYIKNIVTADEHAIRLSEKKFKESKKLNEVIAKNSIDCVFNKYINNVPRDIFKNINPMKMITSQGDEVSHIYGTDGTHGIIDCGVNQLPRISNNLREDTMKMADTIKKKIVRVMTDTRWISLNELKERCLIYDTEKDDNGTHGTHGTHDRYFNYALQMCLAPNVVMKDGSLLFYGNNGLYRRVERFKKVMEVKLEEVEDNKANLNIQKLLLGFQKIDDDFEMLYYMYEAVTNTNWKEIAIEIINNKDKFRRLYDMFVKHGAIIDNYFVDIFNDNENIFDINGNDIDVMTRNKLTKGFVSNEIKSGSYGSFLPLKGKIQFKIHENNNKGAVCTSKQRVDIIKRVEGDVDDMENRKKLCIRIAKQFYEKNRLIIVPNRYKK